MGGGERERENWFRWWSKPSVLKPEAECRYGEIPFHLRHRCARPSWLAELMTAPWNSRTFRNERLQLFKFGLQNSALLNASAARCCRWRLCCGRRSTRATFCRSVVDMIVTYMTMIRTSETARKREKRKFRMRIISQCWAPISIETREAKVCVVTAIVSRGRQCSMSGPLRFLPLPLSFSYTKTYVG